MNDVKQMRCPSSTCEPGHLLLGIVRPDGTLSHISPPIEVDVSFVEKASAKGQRLPESRFRFAGPCVESSCCHWLGERCSVGDEVASAAERPDGSYKLNPCHIRPTCRWWAQNGGAACQICPLIVRSPTLTPSAQLPNQQVLQSRGVENVESTTEE